MKKILIWNVLVIALLLLFAKGVIAEDRLTMPPLSIPDKIDYFADKYHVDSKVMHKIIKCESNYNPKAKNVSSIENSHGLVQININAHKTVTIEQAQDPNFALEFLAENLADGKGRMWTCFRK